MQELGLHLVAVRVADVSPAAEMEKALRQPTREKIQQQADEATFERRALAVEKERAIAENELNNRPRLILNDRAPAELFGTLLASNNRPRCDVD